MSLERPRVSIFAFYISCFKSFLALDRTGRVVESRPRTCNWSSTSQTEGWPGDVRALRRLFSRDTFRAAVRLWTTPF